MKRISAIFSIVMIMFMFLNIQTSLAAEVAEGNKSLNLAEGAKSALLMERDTGKVIYEKNPHEPLPPASMTKIMTLLLVMEAIEEGTVTWDEKVIVSENASSMGGSQVFLDVGEEITIEDLVKSVAIASGNDASVALAERISGSEAAFVDLMNKRVDELNLKNTRFQNSSGLPAQDHYSSAYDMGIIAKELLNHEKITGYTSIYEDYLRKGQENEFWLVNTNKLVRFYPEVDGLKTGFTREAQYCLTASAIKDDMRVISVVMGAEDVASRNSMIMDMIHYAFNHYETEKVFDKGERLTYLKNMKTEKLTYDVITSEQVSLLYKKGEKEAVEINIESELNDRANDLSIKKGDQVGQLIIYKDGVVAHESPLIVNSDVEKASFITLFKRSLANIVKSN